MILSVFICVLCGSIGVGNAFDAEFGVLEIQEEGCFQLFRGKTPKTCSPNVAYQFGFKSLRFWHYSRNLAARVLSYIFAKLNSNVDLLTNGNGFCTFRAPIGVLRSAELGKGTV
jgi:hypothetical protein